MDQNASTTLPPEILDKILDHIPTNHEGRLTLIACALVATWWTGPSQRRLFSSVQIHEGNYKRWMKGVVASGSKAHLMGYVRSLWPSHGPGRCIKYRIRDLPQDSGKYLSALRNLRSLTLSNTVIEHIGEDLRTCFSAFRETLTYLSLTNSATSFSAFVTLVDYFPNIETLELHLFVLRPDEEPVPSLSRPFRGKLHIHGLLVRSLEFFNRFAELELEYEELVISPKPVMGAKTLMSILQISSRTVKYLRLIAEPQYEPAVTICEFRRLQELELKVNRSSHMHETLLSSVASTELRKVTFVVWHTYEWGASAQGMEVWVVIDKQLCELVDRLRAMGYRHTLELELRFVKVGGDPGKFDSTIFLPEFREKGVVTTRRANSSF